MSTDLTPEHSARPPGSTGEYDVAAAYQYVDTEEGIEKKLSPDRGSESSLSEFADDEMPLG